ncbi:MAG TPA: alpha/beta family hydrolase [Thermomicrobiales bacterium]|nr:alpha/beta family hydrolase [Thermomicrobiales bacterium]
MGPESRIEATGYRDRQVPNTFVRQGDASDRLAVFLPGFGYSCDMPLFYYAELLLLSAGVEVLRVEYAYNREPDFRDLPAEEQRAWLLTDAAAALRAGLGEGEYCQLILIGKSIGTRAMGHILTAEPVPPNTRAVWLTPLLRDTVLREHLRKITTPSLLVVGAADDHYDAACLQEIEDSRGHVALVVAGADHSLDIVGDAVGSARAMADVLMAIAAFLDLRR